MPGNLNMHMQSLASVANLDEGFTMIHTNDSLLSKMTKEDLIITMCLKSYGFIPIRIINWI